MPILLPTVFNHWQHLCLYFFRVFVRIDKIQCLPIFGFFRSGMDAEARQTAPFGMVDSADDFLRPVKIMPQPPFSIGSPCDEIDRFWGEYVIPFSLSVMLPYQKMNRYCHKDFKSTDEEPDNSVRVMVPRLPLENETQQQECIKHDYTEVN